MSAFEEAIFRVYDQSMMGLADDDEEHDNLKSKVCRWLETLTLGLVLFYLLALFTLHTDIVGNPGCLQQLLHERMLAENRTDIFPNDAILQINIAPQYRYSEKVDATGTDAMDLGDSRRRKLQHVRSKRGSLDEVAYSWSSSSPYLSADMLPALASAVNVAGRAVGVGAHAYSSVSRLLGNSNEKETAAGEDKDKDKDKSRPSAQSLNGTANATLANSTIPARYMRSYDYEFSTDIAVLSLSNELRAKHNFQLINITLDDASCFGSSFLSRSLVPLGGVDNVVLNNIASTVRKGGMLTTSEGGYYLWKFGDIVLYKHAGEWVTFKATMALKIFFLFFIVSHTTALLVRVLLSCGAIIMYAVLYCTGEGLAVNRMRHMTAAYPWLGMPIEMYLARNESPLPFISAHIQRLVCYYMLYEALQFACSLWFYDNSQPGQQELWLFAAVMFWEYYALLYVRSAESIIFFPRAVFAAFALYHVYLYSFPMGFHMLALMCLMCFVGYLMIFCLRHYEKQAFNRGVVSSDQPRAFSNHISWPTWTHSIAPDFTLFMPVQMRSTNIYDTATGTGAGTGATAPLPEGEEAASAAAVEVEVGEGEAEGEGEGEGAADQAVAAFPAGQGGVELQSIGSRIRSAVSGTQQYQRLEEGTE